MIGKLIGIALKIAATDEQVVFFRTVGPGGPQQGSVNLGQFGTKGAIHAIGARLGNDVDDPGVAARTVQFGTATGSNDNLGDIFHRDQRRVKLTVGGAIKGGTVEEQLDVTGAKTAHIDARGSVSGRADLNAGQHIDGFVEGACTSFLNLFGGHLVGGANGLDPRLLT